jgi:phage terminase large subunit
VPTEEILDRTYSAYGVAAELWVCDDLELLCESGAGTGKTYSLMWHANWVAREYPGCRIAFIRKTRKSLNESVLKDWEEKILYKGHPAITGTSQREHRDKYVYPNGTEIALMGLDNVDRIMSAQFDRIYLFEATEASQDDFEKLLTRLRNSQTPYHQIVCDCNPASEFHWLNSRANQLVCDKCAKLADEEEDVENGLPCQKQGCTGALRYRMTRLLYKHEDNPILFDHDEEGQPTEPTEFGSQYLEQVLGSLTGARRARLLEHRWASEEGVVFEEWDQYLHIVDKRDLPEFEWFFGSMDFGYRVAGVLQVWGVDSEDRMWMVAEIYKSKKQMDWWSDKIQELNREFNFVRIVADSAEPRFIDMLNDRLGILRGRETGGIVLKSDKTRGKLHGIDTAIWALSQAEDGPRAFFVRDCLRFGIDQELRQASRPVCTVQEVPSYCWRKTEENKIEKDEPDPNCVDHGVDAFIYACVWRWGKDFAPSEGPQRTFDPQTYGDWLAHSEVEWGLPGPPLDDD